MSEAIERSGDASDPDVERSPSDELLLDRLVEAWLRLARAGVAPPIAHYAAAHPDVSAELREYLMGAALLEGLGERVRDTAERTLAPGQRYGEVVGDFQIRGVLGRGGMGVVYDALDTRLGRAVALKVLPDSRIGDRRARERFEREAQAAARLDHRCIVPVHGVGESDGQHWYAMQRIDGIGLDELVRALSGAPPAPETSPAAAELAEELARRFRTERVDALEVSPESASTIVTSSLHAPRYANAARIARDVAEALAHAHAAGVLHRDVKPSNVMLDRLGRVWVADFGLCKVAEHGSVTAAGDVVGTLRYMAPERLRGVESAQCDVYSLGLVLYELATGVQAFPEVDRAELVRRIGLDEPLRPSRTATDIPRDLERIVVKAIAKLPEERYTNAEALARDLTAFLEGRPVSARPVGALYLARLFARRNRALVSVVTVAVALLGLATLVYVSGLVRLVRRVDQAHAELQVEATRARLAAATSALGAARLRLARGFLDEIPVEERDWIAAHLQHRANAAGVVFGGGLGEVLDLELLHPPDAQGARAVAVLRANRLSVHALDDGRELATLARSGITGLTAGDAGTALYWISADGGVVERWTYNSAAAPEPLRELGAGVKGFALTDTWLALLDQAAELRVKRHDEERWTTTVSLPESAARARRATLGFAGDFLVAAVDGAGLFELDLVTGLLRDVPLQSVRIGGAQGRAELGPVARSEVSAQLELAPHRAVAFVRPNRIAFLTPGQGGAAEVHTADMRLTAFSVDRESGRVYLANLAGMLSEWIPNRSRSDALGQVHSSAVTAVLSVDTSRIFVTGSDGGEVRIGEVRPVLDRQLGIDACRVHVPAVTALAVSADGRTLASGDAAGGLALWDLARVEPVVASATLGPRVVALALAADGHAVLAAGAATRLWRPGAPDSLAVSIPEVLPVGPSLAAHATPFGFEVVTIDGALVALDAEGVELGRVPPPPAEGERWTAATIGGDPRHPWSVALGAEEGALWVLADPDGVGDRVWRALPARSSPVRSLALAPDGRELAVADGAGELTRIVLSAKSGGALEPEVTFEVVAAERGERRNGLSTVAFGRDGRWLLTASESGALLTWWRASGAAGAALVQIWPPLTALAVPKAGAPAVVGDGHGRVSVLQVAPAAPARGAQRPALTLEDGALLLDELEAALPRAAAGEPWVRAAAIDQVQGLRRRQRFGTIDLGPQGGARLAALAEALGAPPAEDAE